MSTVTGEGQDVKRGGQAGFISHKIEIPRFMAYSLDMIAEADEKAIQRASLSTARVIPTPYQFRLTSQGIPNPNRCCLFVVVANRGGNVEGMNIRIV